MAKRDTKKKEQLELEALPTELEVEPEAVVPSKTTHTVMENETLGEIATKYQLSLNRLLVLNELSNTNVEVGTQLFVE